MSTSAQPPPRALCCQLLCAPGAPRAPPSSSARPRSCLGPLMPRRPRVPSARAPTPRSRLLCPIRVCPEERS
eukprot:9811091-Alexandrium_andersonii.AAC.1